MYKVFSTHVGHSEVPLEHKVIHERRQTTANEKQKVLYYGAN